MSTYSWNVVRQLPEHGQAWLEVVEAPELVGLFVRKILKVPARADRMQREIEALRALRGLLVVDVIDVGTLKKRSGVDLPYYVMPFYPRGSLEAGKGCAFEGSAQVALRAFYDLATTLRRVHERNIFHRDLKPDNVLVRDDAVLLIADFGLAHLVDEHGSRLTRTLEQHGSRFYMAPECLDGRADFVGPAPDIYAMGKILHFLLTGEHLPDLEPTRTSVRPLEHTADATLRSCIVAMTQRNPSARLSGFDQSMRAIQEVLDPTQIPPPSPLLSGRIGAARKLALAEQGRARQAEVNARERYTNRGVELVRFVRRRLKHSSVVQDVIKLAEEIGWKFDSFEDWPGNEPFQIDAPSNMRPATPIYTIRLRAPSNAHSIFAVTFDRYDEDHNDEPVSLIIGTASALELHPEFGWHVPKFAGDDLRIVPFSFEHPGDSIAVDTLTDEVLERWNVHNERLLQFFST